MLLWQKASKVKCIIVMLYLYTLFGVIRFAAWLNKQPKKLAGKLMSLFQKNFELLYNFVEIYLKAKMKVCLMEGLHE